jgi:hypothetical protein
MPFFAGVGGVTDAPVASWSGQLHQSCVHSKKSRRARTKRQLNPHSVSLLSLALQSQNKPCLCNRQHSS